MSAIQETKQLGSDTWACNAVQIPQSGPSAVEGFTDTGDVVVFSWQCADNNRSTVVYQHINEGDVLKLEQVANLTHNKEFVIPRPDTLPQVKIVHSIVQ